MIASFNTLKLTSVEPVAGWSWFLVLSPFWGPVALVFTVAAIAGFVCVKDDDDKV